jgi:hypothetical protein
MSYGVGGSITPAPTGRRPTPAMRDFWRCRPVLSNMTRVRFGSGQNGQMLDSL